jgi:hypothetical protein
MLICPFKLKAVDDGVLDDVAESVVCVISGVRADEYIRKFLEP